MQKILAPHRRNLLKYFRDHASRRAPLAVLVCGTCSEVARLVALWLEPELPAAKMWIAQGAGVFGKNDLKHDLLAIEMDGKVSLVDPTIWQFFPRRREIFLGDFTDEAAAFAFLGKAYGGAWRCSEVVGPQTHAERPDLEKMIAESAQIADPREIREVRTSWRSEVLPGQRVVEWGE